MNKTPMLLFLCSAALHGQAVWPPEDVVDDLAQIRALANAACSAVPPSPDAWRADACLALRLTQRCAEHCAHEHTGGCEAVVFKDTQAHIDAVEFALKAAQAGDWKLCVDQLDHSGGRLAALAWEIVETRGAVQASTDPVGLPRIDTLIEEAEAVLANENTRWEENCSWPDPTSLARLNDIILWAGQVNSCSQDCYCEDAKMWALECRDHCCFVETGKPCIPVPKVQTTEKHVAFVKRAWIHINSASNSELADCSSSAWKSCVDELNHGDGGGGNRLVDLARIFEFKLRRKMSVEEVETRGVAFDAFGRVAQLLSVLSARVEVVRTLQGGARNQRDPFTTVEIEELLPWPVVREK